MRFGPKFLVLALMAAPLTASNMGTGCSLSGIVPRVSTVDFVFVNETVYDVDVVINNAYFSTVPGGAPVPTAPISVNCFAGDQFAISGDLVISGGAVQSPDQIVFNEGFQFLCGDTIQVNYFLDAAGVLRLEGQAFGP